MADVDNTEMEKAIDESVFLIIVRQFEEITNRLKSEVKDLERERRIAYSKGYQAGLRAAEKKK
jgi:hypothetical protein